MGIWENHKLKKERKRLEVIQQQNVLGNSTQSKELGKDEKLAIQRQIFKSRGTQIKEALPSILMSGFVMFAGYLVFGSWLFFLSAIPLGMGQYVYTSRIWRPPSVLLRWFGMDEQGVIHDHTILVPKDMWNLVSKENIEGTMHIREGDAYHVESIDYENDIEGGFINKVKFAWHHHSQFDFFNRFAEYDTMRTLYYITLKENSLLKNLSHIMAIRDAIKTTDSRMDSINSAYKLSEIQVSSKVADINERVDLMDKERKLIEQEQKVNSGVDGS